MLDEGGVAFRGVGVLARLAAGDEGIEPAFGNIHTDECGVRVDNGGIISFLLFEFMAHSAVRGLTRTGVGDPCSATGSKAPGATGFTGPGARGMAVPRAFFWRGNDYHIVRVVKQPAAGAFLRRFLRTHSRKAPAASRWDLKTTEHTRRRNIQGAKETQRVSEEGNEIQINADGN